jgi:lipid A 3-O-deacylase
MYLKKISLLLLLVVFFTPSHSETSKNPKISEVKNDYNFFVGTFDTIDKEGDDKTSLFGIEHNNTNLFRDTIFGKFSPVTGGFISGNNSVYLYTGVQAQYNIGPLKVIPSFAPGYYEAGHGKDLGSVLEFKSEIRFDLEIFEDSKIGYSYNHISNNDWGKINPGINNQQISFSKNF